ncbi:hypothetical protein P8V03_18020 [Clostridium sp. A1-XYC3]|uniref:Uncharacterized protein n=1 Tax=Clostridium tanneri TaxID=3037988 RepID=A0ABU4JY49_9CLOT|nr:hypothetical protein [Clostridium sp. A1-XYC3]MDW8803037.1 hypothetical protein [Clostridium sp. A1-XYC3]
MNLYEQKIIKFSMSERITESPVIASLNDAYKSAEKLTKYYFALRQRILILLKSIILSTAYHVKAATETMLL